MNTIKVRYRRWRCDHFDHPFRQVREFDVNTQDSLEFFSSLITSTWADIKHCNYCDRDFELPLFHVNCRCDTVVVSPDFRAESMAFMPKPEVGNE